MTSAERQYSGQFDVPLSGVESTNIYCCYYVFLLTGTSPALFFVSFTSVNNKENARLHI